jgi:hypothetical protein
MIPSNSLLSTFCSAANSSLPQRALVVCLTLAIVFVSARTVARLVKERAVVTEDYFCWLAIAAYISLIGLYFNILDIVYMVMAVAEGRALPTASFLTQGDHMMRCLFAVQLLFWTTLYSVKFSLLFLCRRLTLGLPRYQMIWTGVVIFTIFSFLGSIVSELTSCNPLRTYFHLGMLRHYLLPILIQLFRCEAGKEKRAQHT